MNKVTIQDFTGVYAEQPFMQGLRDSAATDKNIHWFDCTQVDGTDCYCDDEAQAILRQQIESVGNDSFGIHFFDNGNYHYMSKLWTDSVREPFDLVVFDHHPDIQPPRFEGILSCGGWIKEVLDHNKFVQNVTVIGVADHLVEEIREDLTQVSATEILNRVTFIRESELNSFGKDPSTLPNGGVYPELAEGLRMTHPCHISIDKDALSTTEAATNWDQGSLTFEQLADSLQVLAQNHKILGIDICGERARDMGFEDTAAADALNNALNEKLYNLITTLVERRFPPSRE